MELYITAGAYQDLDEIEAYTTQAWGTQQAERYLDTLYAAIDRIMANPALLLRSNDRISEHLVFYRAEKHFIFCDVTENRLSVLSIQHAARDLPARITELETLLAAEAEMLHKQTRGNF